jgi:hypothetical protein
VNRKIGFILCIFPFFGIVSCASAYPIVASVATNDILLRETTNMVNNLGSQLENAKFEKDLNSAVSRSVQTLMESINKDESVAIINVSSSYTEMAEFAIGELEVSLLNNGYFLVDRSNLDNIRQEHDLQPSGDVDDYLAVSIGKFIGANIVIVGNISGSSSLRRLRLRALEAETARVVVSTSEQF